MKTPVIVLAIIILLAVFGPQILYTVDETQLVVITRFGEIRDIHLDSGLKVKVPFIDSANRFDKRVLRVDVLPSRFPDKDNEFLDIDAYVRYRIIHEVDGVKTKAGVRKFFEKLGNLESAEDRIGRIVISSLREEVAQREKEEIIGAIIGKVVTDDETGEVTREVTATNARQDILDKVRAASDAAVKSPENDFGVEILDVRIKRADFPEAAQQSIFSRMRSEREVISRELRAQGQEERDTIEADANRQRTIILAEAERDAARLRGDGEAQAILIFAGALEQDPEFFAFQRSLEAYKKFLSTNSTIILSSEADLFRFLEDPAGRSNDIQP